MWASRERVQLLQVLLFPELQGEGVRKGAAQPGEAPQGPAGSCQMFNSPHPALAGSSRNTYFFLFFYWLSLIAGGSSLFHVVKIKENGCPPVIEAVGEQRSLLLWSRGVPLAPHLDEGGASLAAQSSLGAAAGLGSHRGCRLVPGIVLQQHMTGCEEKLRGISFPCSRAHTAQPAPRAPTAHRGSQAHRWHMLSKGKLPTPFRKQENTQGISSLTL